ncbi:VOC family protein [Urechidicola vernalis]|uniref:VOC family protein n=1 Tax=Urechidicola vernalis TaxID=3075600 RepID=A0ABU2Y8B8_9FLAO|nr:VOC family protein [Urechidicola sp. P050]MDT0553967.1 VOC family protein [Urechidicola sp. P050]
MVRKTKTSRLILCNSFFSLALLFLSYNAFSQSFEFSNSHLALHVKDVSVSADFYSKVLHITEMETPEGIPSTTRWFQLADQSEIHLIESKELVKLPKGIHLSIATNHLKELMKHLKSFNIHFENWWGEATVTNMRGDNVEQIYFQDPDGYWIEVNDDVK